MADTQSSTRSQDEASAKLEAQAGEKVGEDEGPVKTEQERIDHCYNVFMVYSRLPLPELYHIFPEALLLQIVYVGQKQTDRTIMVSPRGFDHFEKMGLTKRDEKGSKVLVASIS